MDAPPAWASLNAQRERPSGRSAGFQRWRKLLFLHWEVDADLLRSKLPEELELDTFEGRALVGVVPFTMRDVSPWWSPSVPGISNFHELNVRAYVRHKGIPGVWFFSLDAANALAVMIARTGWSLPYHKADMRIEEHEGVVSYQSERRWPAPTPATFSARYRLLGDPETPRVAEDGSLDHFLVERYVLFAKQEGKPLRIGRVHHKPYPLREVLVLSVEQTLLQALELPPTSERFLSHYSEGVDVDVFALEPVA